MAAALSADLLGTEMVRRIEIIVGMAALLAASPVSAHEAHVDGIFRHWTSDPWVTIPIGLSGLLYASGFARLSHKSGIGTGRRRWQTACFVAGWLTLVLALISPIHWLGERLFSRWDFKPFFESGAVDINA